MARDCNTCGGYRPRVVRTERVRADSARTASAKQVSYRVVDPAGEEHTPSPDTLVAARALRRQIGGAIRTIRS